MSEQTRRGAADPLDLERLEAVAKAAEHAESWTKPWVEFRRHATAPVTLALIAALRAEQARVREAETQRDDLSNVLRIDCFVGPDMEPVCVAGTRGCAIEHDKIALGAIGIPALTEAWQKAEAEVRALREQVKGQEETLHFYADPMTYFAIGLFPDQPCGAFMEDLSETEDLGWKPGRRARAALSPSSETKEPA